MSTKNPNRFTSSNPTSATNPGFPGNAPLVSCFISFEKEKSPSEVVSALAEGNIFAAISPGSGSSSADKVIEVLVPNNLGTESIRHALTTTFSDFVDATCNVTSFTIGVPAADYKQAKTVLKKVALRVSPFERVTNGNAFFNVVVNPSIDASLIAECLTNSKVTTDHIVPSTDRPQAFTQPTFAASSASHGFWPNWNPAYTTAYTPAWNTPSNFENPNPNYPTANTGNFNLRFVCENVLPIIGRDLMTPGHLTQAITSCGLTPTHFFKALTYAAQAWSYGMNQPATSNWNFPTPQTTNDPSGTGRAIQRIYTELCNTNSPICQTLNQMGLHPNALGAVLAPFCATPAFGINPGTPLVEDFHNTPTY
jgi:hypothetical protein